MKYEILSAITPETLVELVKILIREGWEPVGAHQVVVVHEQNRFRGEQHMDTIHKTEYSQTMCKKTNENVIKVDISFYHPNDDETIKVYDIEGMREEFNYKLNQLK